MNQNDLDNQNKKFERMFSSSWNERCKNSEIIMTCDTFEMSPQGKELLRKMKQKIRPDKDEGKTLGTLIEETRQNLKIIEELNRGEGYVMSQV